jgi:hypothetical protein
VISLSPSFLPKPPFAGDYPRDDMGKQLVELYDLNWAPVE